MEVVHLGPPRLGPRLLVGAVQRLVVRRVVSGVFLRLQREGLSVDARPLHGLAPARGQCAKSHPRVLVRIGSISPIELALRDFLDDGHHGVLVIQADQSAMGEVAPIACTLVSVKTLAMSSFISLE